MSESERDTVFSCPHCGSPMARTVEQDLDIHSGAGYTCDQCLGQVIFEAMTPRGYCAYATAMPSGPARDREIAARAVEATARSWAGALGDDRMTGKDAYCYMQEYAARIRAGVVDPGTSQEE